MKPFLFTILASALLSTAGGCRTSELETLKEAIRTDINQYIDGCSCSLEGLSCRVASVDVKTLFSSISMLKQMEKIKTLAYDLESLDGKTCVKYWFMRPGMAKKIVTDPSGKIHAAAILNNGKYYESKDGILYSPGNGNSTLEWLYDLNMELAQRTGSVSVLTYDSYHFNAESQDQRLREVVCEPLEMIVDNVRCCRFSLNTAINKENRVNLVLFVNSAFNSDIVRMEFNPDSDSAPFPPAVLSLSRFFYSGGFRQPGFVSIALANPSGTEKTGKPGRIEYTIKNIRINQPVAASEFEPDVLDSKK